MASYHYDHKINAAVAGYTFSGVTIEPGQVLPGAWQEVKGEQGRIQTVKGGLREIIARKTRANFLDHAHFS